MKEKIKICPIPFAGPIPHDLENFWPNGDKYFIVAKLMTKEEFKELYPDQPTNGT